MLKSSTDIRDRVKSEAGERRDKAGTTLDNGADGEKFRRTLREVVARNVFSPVTIDAYLLLIIIMRSIETVQNLRPRRQTVMICLPSLLITTS